MRLGRFIHAGLCMLAVVSLPACVPVNERPKTGLTHVDPATGEAIARVPGSRQGLTDSRVRVGIRPLGAVPFDGMTLPITSPDGRFIAAQSGAVPPWATLLAEPGSSVPARLTLSFAEIRPPTGAPSPAIPGEPTGAIIPLAWAGTLPRGLLLGRSATDRGVLVERPDESGGRSIGLVEWKSGQTRWLISDPASIAAHASFGPRGELAYSRRSLAETAGFELVVRPISGDASRELVLKPRTDETLVFPTFSADQTRVYVFSAATRLVNGFGPLTLLCVRLPGTGQGSLAVERRIELDVEPTIAAAFQAVAAIQTPWILPGPTRADEDLAAGIAIADLRTGGMMWVDARTGSVQPLARGTAGAAPWWSVGPSSKSIEIAGLVLGAAKELVYQPQRNGGQWGSEVSVLAGAAIPRLAGTLSVSAERENTRKSQPRVGERGVQPRFLLISPPPPARNGTIGSSGGGSLQLIEMVPIDD